jgi:P4 family phage/plasmid primase-like protien
MNIKRILELNETPLHELKRMEQKKELTEQDYTFLKDEQKDKAVYLEYFKNADWTIEIKKDEELKTIYRVYTEPKLTNLERKNQGTMKIISFFEKRNLMFYKNTFYLYENNHYKEKTELELMNKLTENEKLNLLINEKMQKEIMLKLKRKFFKDENEINKNENILCLKNCLFDMNQLKAINYSKDLFVTRELPITYDPKAKCKEIDKFLNNIVKNKEELYEITALSILPHYKLSKAIILYGENNNGKSKFLRLLEATLGSENIANESLHDLCSDPHSSIELNNRLANIYSDLPKNAINDTNKLKVLTGEDYISGHKKFKNRIKFKNTAKLYFSCNELPIIKNKDGGTYKRLHLINFPYYFKPKEQITKEEKKNGMVKPEDKNILEKIINEKELSGFFNEIIKQAKRLDQKGTLSKYVSPEQTEFIYSMLSESMNFFLDRFISDISDEMDDEEGDGDPKKLFYKEYENFCKAIKSKPVRSIYFTKALNTLYSPKIIKRKIFLNGNDKYVRCCAGLKVIDWRNKLKELYSEAEINSKLETTLLINKKKEKALKIDEKEEN